MHPEFYCSLHAPEASSVVECIEILRKKLESVLRNFGDGSAQPLLMRFFSSDVHAHAALLEKIWPGSGGEQRVYIGQAPLDSAWLSLQVWAVPGVESTLEPDGALKVRHGGYESFWSLHYPSCQGDSRKQSEDIIAALKCMLAKRGLNMADHLLRTWFYVRDIDNNYAGMVSARVAAYEKNGLGPGEHFVASTGIQGNSPHPADLVAMQAHACKGLLPEQITYLKALSHLSPTHDYGVNFERATRVVYGDRAHIHLSGTASIDCRGDVLHVGDVRMQLERTLENIEALLTEGGMTLADMKCATVYLRDIWDFRVVNGRIKEMLPPNCAINITCGAVCRPDWLVEIEGEAVKQWQSDYPDFV